MHTATGRYNTVNKTTFWISSNRSPNSKRSIEELRYVQDDSAVDISRKYRACRRKAAR